MNIAPFAGAALDINNLGQILIHSQDDRAFVWTEGDGLVLIETLGGDGSTARRINDRGEIVGWSQKESGNVHAFLITEENGIMDLETLGGPESIALSINNLSWVVGHSDITPSVEHALKWKSTTGMQDLNTLIPEDSGWVLLTAEDINDSGQIVGEGKFNGQTRAFLLTPISTQIVIDIKPGDDSNSINLKSKGVIPVAVLSSNYFDAYNINPDTCLFEDVEPERWTMEDVDHDGDIDMLFHIKTQELNLIQESTEATLTGELYNGTPIEGTIV